MGRKTSSPPPEQEKQSSSGFFKTIKRGFYTLVVVLVIAYGGLLLISTTDGFRKMREDSLSDKLQIPVSLVSTKFDPLLRLHYTGLRLGEDSHSPPAVIDHVQVTYDLTRGVGRIVGCDMEGVQVHLDRRTPVNDATRLLYVLWNPLAAVAGLYRPLTINAVLDVNVQNANPEWLMDIPNVSIEGLTLLEHDEAGGVALQISDATIYLGPLNIPEKEYRYIQFTADSYSRRDGVSGTISIEWIEGDEKAVLLAGHKMSTRPHRGNLRPTEEIESKPRYLLDSESRTRVKIPRPVQ